MSSNLNSVKDGSQLVYLCHCPNVADRSRCIHVLRASRNLLDPEVVGRQASVVDVENQAGVVGGGVEHLGQGGGGGGGR